MKASTLLLSALLLALFSCEGEKKRVAFYDDTTDEMLDDTSYLDNSLASTSTAPTSPTTVAVPFTERNGVKYIEVTVNGVGFEMILDTGASITLISEAEANYLYKKGHLTADDIIGTSQQQIADGSIVENMVVRLKEVVIGDQLRYENVIATVANNANAPLLLGNEVLNRHASYAIDNEHKTINFTLK